VFGPYQSGSLDSSECGGDWANDTYTRTYIVAPQSDGSFQVTELFNGSFVTLAGKSPGTPCATIDAGITGQFYGDYVLTVPVKTQGSPAYFNFNFNATPSTNVTTDVFFNAVFHQAPPDNYAWQFHYVTANHGTWDNTDTGNAGNILN
jgi:hypothetical protein